MSTHVNSKSQSDGSSRSYDIDEILSDFAAMLNLDYSADRLLLEVFQNVVNDMKAAEQQQASSKRKGKENG